MLNICEATIAEIPRIATMWEAIDDCATVHHFGGRVSSSVGRTIEIITHAIDSPTASVLTAFKQNKLVGTITGHLYQRPAVRISAVGIIYSLWVNEKFRRQGIGQALLETIEQHLIQMGAEAFQVGWDISNPIASDWWQKRGYKPYETIASKNI